MSKGRVVPIYRPGVNRAGEVTIPSCDLTLPDGRCLVYRGRTAPQSVGGGAMLTLSAWYSADGLAVAASIDRLPHLTIKSKLGFLHLSISRDDRLPDWDEMVQVAETIAGPDLDMAMIKPRRSDYINKHEYCLHWWEMPVEWGVTVSKGRKVPDSPIDHAAQLRDRLGRAAYVAWQVETGQLPLWEQLSSTERMPWHRIGQAVMDVIVDTGDRRGEFSVSSIYGYASQKPYVNIDVSLSPMQCSPAKAREMALMLLEAADASESDATLIGYARDVLDLDERGAAQLLQQLRQYRQKQLGTEANSA